jgi:hypothetical protein
VGFGGEAGWLSGVEKTIVSNLNMAFAEVAFKYGGASTSEVISHKLCSHRFVNKILNFYFSLNGIAPCEVFIKQI